LGVKSRSFTKFLFLRLNAIISNYYKRLIIRCFYMLLSEAAKVIILNKPNVLKKQQYSAFPLKLFLV